ncbi:UNVERIFIED_ORG: quinoprotein relay system zinc metallohydrolase 1 [Pseudomonas parafulva]|uniref:Quinoprotein relay system zinc metallohydrolase 1 n=1 Tax=Pseudomonas fulva TaxID=47880 RepID=A0A7S9QAF8_9PSED|nr:MULTISPECIES: quinoprotein relay system zinc metallohydrolase 1 [Pseudomonas]MDP9555512.1 quinoprotein relay system zinc metallohydrolase 1 [Pseudomonas parafulva]MBA1206324.1 quinoprotein relay system zinc metallohydrolase 1 [Pseudomonas fulva]MBA1215599.1 quinoprotein relay system zinc metallohydrolase 1 [Pseudomonas fulva]MBA1220464.1 quinoprotein relay system zinc metallohydrolase 1 [Pseudomonas fulva]MBH3365237.1 quinoprotein relay system zinc metallohydrolase 1 [Pseudomonas sp. URMO17
MRWMMLLLLGVGLPALADFDYRLAPRQIAQGTWVLEGSTDNFQKANGGNVVNTAFIVTDAGVVVIDSGPSKRYGEAMRQAIAGVTDKAVIEVLLTHHHPDHVLGNQAFAEVPIAALAGTTELLRQQGDAMTENMYRLVGDWMRGTEVVLPTEVVQPGRREVGGHRLRLLGLAGHTGADLAIFDETTGVLFAGDLVFYERALTTPNSPGLDVWQRDLDTLQALPWQQLVPGHGPVASDSRPFAQMHDYLRWLDGLMREGAEQGADMVEMIRSPVPERFAAISLTRYELIRSVSHLYPRYEKQVMQRVDVRP